MRRLVRAARPQAAAAAFLRQPHPQRRSVAQYGVTLLSHEQLVVKYSGPPSKQLQAAVKAPTTATAAAAAASGVDGETAQYAGILALVERVEQCLFHWRLNKWEFRIPVLLSQEEKDRAGSQLARIKDEIIGRLAIQQRNRVDLDFLQSSLGVDEDQLRTKTRAWVQEKVSDLRWRGEVQLAKQVREAWVRLEESGSREHGLLQRLCCVYGLARLGTFDTAFSNYIVPRTHLAASTAATAAAAAVPGGASSAVSSFTGQIVGGAESSENDFPVALDATNPFEELMRLVVTRVPALDVCFDFMGYNPTEGYRASLGKYMRMCMEAKQAVEEGRPVPVVSDADDLANQAASRDPRILFLRAPGATANPAASLPGASDSTSSILGAHHVGNDFEILFDHARNETIDYVHVRGSDVTLISIASANKWKAQSQLPHRKQMEGIARRTAFVFGIPYDSVRVRNLFLPPAYVDRASLGRINRVISGTTDQGEALDGKLPSVHPAFAPWVSSYGVQLQPEDEDYAAQTAKHPEEEWVKL